MEPQLGYSIGSVVCPGLSKLIEESGEVVQVAGKIIATGGMVLHWDGTHLRQRMTDELADLIAAIHFFAEANGLDGAVMDDRARAKLTTFREWHAKQSHSN